MADNADDTDADDADVLYTTTGATRLHTRRDCPSLVDAEPIQEHSPANAPDRPLCGGCGTGTTPTHSVEHPLSCPYCGARVSGALALREHVNDANRDSD